MGNGALVTTIIPVFNRPVLLAEAVRSVLDQTYRPLLYRFARATPFLAPRAYFRASQRDKELEELFKTAGICFVAEAAKESIER